MFNIPLYQVLFCHSILKEETDSGEKQSTRDNRNDRNEKRFEPHSAVFEKLFLFANALKKLSSIYQRVRLSRADALKIQAIHIDE